MALRTIQAVSIATAANLVGRASNVALPLAIIAMYGANSHTDLFFLILAIGFYGFGTLANAIAESTVPLLIASNLRLKASNILHYTATISLLGMLLGGILGGTVSRIDPIYAMALALMVGAGIANGFFTGILNSQERYAPAGLTWALRFIPLAGVMIYRPAAGQLPWLALGIGVMDWMRCVILIRCRQQRSGHFEQIDLKNFIHRYRSTFGAVSIAMLILGFNPLIDCLIAQLSGPGGISILDVAGRAYGILATLCTIGLMTVLLTRFSQDASNGHLEQKWPEMLKKIILWCLLWVLVGIPAGHWGLDWWLEKGTVLSIRQSAIIKQTYWFYLMGLPGFVVGMVYAKRLQAVRHSTILAVTAVVAVVLNLALSLILHMVLGIPGIALATTLVYAITAMVLITAINRKSRHIEVDSKGSRGTA